MKIWVIKEGEPLPIDNNPRLMRTGLLSEYLDRQGNHVTWFSSTFSHGQKYNRTNTESVLPLFSHSKLILLKSKNTYKKNISFSRLRYSNQLAKRFIHYANNEEKPDLIICSYPTISFAHVATKFGKKHNVPVIIDIRDLWPDIFVRAFPSKLIFIGKILIFPLILYTRTILKSAFSLTAIVPSHLSWALNRAKRIASYYDRVIPIGYKNEVIDITLFNESLSFWAKYGVSSETWNICFFGTLSEKTMDLDTVIDTVMNYLSDIEDLRLIIAGNGDGYEHYLSMIKGSKNIIMPGWINKNQITSLMSISKAGLYPFHNLTDFVNSMTNKFVEYMYGSLPILSSLSGYSKDYINEHNLGIVYNEGDKASLEKSIRILYNDKEKQSFMSSNSYHRYLEDFESDSINQKFLDLAQEITNIMKKY